MRHASLALLAVLLAPAASAHGDLELNELEVLAIRDFEGQEDSFPWEGFEIWDVYVGEGYNDTLGAHGVYFKVNFAGDGTQRPTGGAAWTVTFTFTVGEETFERAFTHDGATITTSFESLQWLVADGNVLQVKAWAPVEDAVGKSVRDIVIVSSVDGSPRDTAPGGVHDPATGRETPVQAPSTVVFPPLGEGRIVDEVPLSGAAKYFDLVIEPKPNNTYTLTVTNVLETQGQHVVLDADPAPGWEIVTADAPHSLDGQKSGTYDIQLFAKGEPGTTLAPYSFDLLSDIGGRRTLHAYLDEAGQVHLTEDATLAKAATVATAPRGVPGFGVVVLLAVGVACAAVRGRR